MYLISYFFVFTSVLGSNLEENSIFIAFHKEINEINVKVLNGSRLHCNPKMSLIIFQFSSELYYGEENDILLPFVYKLSYTIKHGKKIDIKFIDNDNNILFNCFIAHNNSNGNNLVTFYKYPDGALRNTDNSFLGTINYLRAEIMNVIHDGIERKIWVIADNELLQVQLVLSIEYLEFLSLYCQLSRFTDVICLMALSAIRDEIDIVHDTRINEFIRRSVKCIFVFSYVTHKAMAFYRSTYFAEEFLVNGSISQGMKMIVDFNKKDSDKGFDSINESCGTFEYFINHSGLFKPDLLPDIKHLFDVIKSRTFILRKNLKERIEVREKMINKSFINLKEEEEAKTHLDLIKIFFNHIKIDKYNILMNFEEDLERWICFNIRKEQVERCFDLKNLMVILKLFFAFEKYVSQPTRSNLQRLLQHTDLKYVSIKGSNNFLKSVREKVEKRQVRDYGFPTHEMINYDVLLEDILKQMEAFNEIMTKRDVLSMIPIHTLILYFLNTN